MNYRPRCPGAVMHTLLVASILVALPAPQALTTPDGSRVGPQTLRSHDGTGRDDHLALAVPEDRLRPSIGAPVSYNVGTVPDGFVPNAAPIDVVTADFNRDGRLDLAVAHTSESLISILQGNGDGTFQAAVNYAMGEPIQGDLFAGDFNGDRALDLFTPAGGSGSNNFTTHPAILPGNGDGTFRAPVRSSSFGPSRGWAVGDFTGDATLDLVSTNPTAYTVTVLPGNGDGTFQSGIVSPPLFNYSRWVTAADFNRDGKLDLAIADGTGAGTRTNQAELTILLGNGNGTFHLGGHYPSPQTGTEDETINPEDVFAADLNQDGKLDAIVCNYSHNVNVFFGNGDGSFQPAVGIDTGEYPRALAVVDLNLDNTVDLVVVGVGINLGGAEFKDEGVEPGSVAILLGKGDGSFQDPVHYQPFAFPGWAATGDFNGDRFPDLAVTRVLDGHSVNVMLNQPSSSNLPPTVATDASATPNPVSGTTTDLAVLGADDGGEANLTYTWAVLPTPPAPVTFSANGTHAAQNTTATFSKAGTYDLAVTITDRAGVSAISIVTVTVERILARPTPTIDDARTLTVTSLAGDGRVRYYDYGSSGGGQAQWDAAHDLAAGNEADHVTASRGNWVSTAMFFGNGVNIMRGYLVFDTSTLPPDAVITSATVGVFVTDKADGANDGDDFVTIVRGLQASPTSLSFSDYSRAGNAIDHPTEGANRVDITGMDVNAYVQWNLNAAGLAWIAPAGITQFALREGHDVLDRWPNYANGQGNAISAMMSEQAGTSQDPYLQITYTIPAPGRPPRAAHPLYFPLLMNRLSRNAGGAISAGVRLLRMAPAAYADGISAPAGAGLPSARAISNAVSTQIEDLPNDRWLSDLVYIWGQFLDHDLDFTPAESSERFDIGVPPGDTWFDPSGTGKKVISFTRSTYDPATGTSLANPRQQVNVITAHLDGSQVYGSDGARAAALRTFAGGRLKTSAGNLLPVNTDLLPNENDARIVPDNRLFLAGDERANENIELTVMHTLFVREHNRRANQIASANPSWSDEQIYQAARQIVVAELQVITYEEFLPALLGADALPPYTAYNPSINPNIATEFSTAAFRFGHSMLDDDIERRDNDGQEIPGGDVRLRDAFFNPRLLDPSLPNHEGDIDPILKGAASGNAQEIDPRLIDDVRNFLFGPPGAGGFDLAARNIQRGRDHGLADYNSTRTAYGLPRIASFAALTSNAALRQQLASVYPDVNHVDLWVGALAEDHVPGASVGPLTRAILVDQFRRLRDGDRSWVEQVFWGLQLQALQATRLSDIIRANTAITRIQDDAFFFVDNK